MGLYLTGLLHANIVPNAQKIHYKDGLAPVLSTVENGTGGYGKIKIHEYLNISR